MKEDGSLIQIKNGWKIVELIQSVFDGVLYIFSRILSKIIPILDTLSIDDEVESNFC